MAHARIPRGGKPVSGAELGIIGMDFEAGIAQPVGGILNLASFAHPVQVEFGDYGGLDLIAEKQQWVADSFIDATQRLAARGATVVMGACGMLGQYQSDLAARSPIPVATSSLLQVPLVLRLLGPDRKVLVVGVDAGWIRWEHLLDCGTSEADRDRVVIRGMEDAEHFRGNLLGHIDVYDLGIAEQELLGTVAKALEDEPSIGAIVFECTDLPPFADAARKRFGLPVWHSLSLAGWLQSGARPDNFEN